MKIEVRLFATLRDGRAKVLDMKVAQNSSARKILELLDIRQEDVALLLVNGRDGNLDEQLAEGDVLSLFPPVGGG
jgi:molybdopterin converting factor small subunit